MDSAQNTVKKGGRGLRRLYICLVIFLAALFFQAATGFGLIPTEGIFTLRELAGHIGEAMARSDLVEAFAEGFRSAAQETEVFAETTVASSKAADTARQTTSAEAAAETTTASLPLLTKRTDG